MCTDPQVVCGKCYTNNALTPQEWTKKFRQEHQLAQVVLQKGATVKQYESLLSMARLLQKGAINRDSGETYVVEYGQVKIDFIPTKCCGEKENPTATLAPNVQ